MKYILVVLAGACDKPVAQLGERTPLDAAKLSNLHFFAKSGKVGTVKLLTDKTPFSPDAVLMNALGYDIQKDYPGRGPLDAANCELNLEDNEVAFSMHFVTEANGVLADSTAGLISTKEARVLTHFLNKKLASDFVRFYSGGEYRNVVVIKDSHGFAALSARTQDPRMVEGKVIQDILPKGPGDEALKKLMFDAKLLLQDHEINQVRVDLGQNPANMIWLWGQGRRPALTPLKEKYDFQSGAIIAAREYALGLARLTGLTAVEVRQEGLEFHEYCERVVRAFHEAVEEKDFVMVVLHSAEEASLAGDLSSKVSSLEATDFFVLSKIREYLQKNVEARLLITPGFSAAFEERNYNREPVPFAMIGKNVFPDDVEKFTELAAKASELKLGKPAELMDLLFKS